MTSIEEEWQERQDRIAEEAERHEASMRAGLDAERARLAARQEREPAEIAALLRERQIALMGGGSLNEPND